MKQSEIEEIKKLFDQKFGTDTAVITNNSELVEPIIAVWHFIEGLVENGTLMTKTRFMSEEYAEGLGTAKKLIATERRKAVEEFVNFACKETYKEEKFFECPECGEEKAHWRDDDVIYCSNDRRRLKLMTRNRNMWDNDNVVKREIRAKVGIYLKESEAENETKN